MRFTPFLKCLSLLGLAAIFVPANAQDSLEDLRAADLQIAQIGEALSVRNAAMCDPSGWRTGLVLHDIRQYDFPDSVKPVFGFESDKIGRAHV